MKLGYQIQFQVILMSLRRSLFSNLMIYLKKNINRNFPDLSLFEVGPVFRGKNLEKQLTMIGGLKPESTQEKIG